MNSELYQVTTSYACAGIVVSNGIVIDSAPIYTWMRGKSLETIKGWKRIQKIVKCRNES